MSLRDDFWRVVPHVGSRLRGSQGRCSNQRKLFSKAGGWAILVIGPLGRFPIMGDRMSRSPGRRLPFNQIRRGLIHLCVLVLVWSPAAARHWSGDEDRNIEKQAVKRVRPTYPPLAQRYRIQGTVTVQLTVGKDGKVDSAEFVRGHNIFRSVSLDAAKRWEFKPPGESHLEGVIQFTFKLAD